MKKNKRILLVDDDLLSYFLNKEIPTAFKVTNHLYTSWENHGFFLP